MRGASLALSSCDTYAMLLAPKVDVTSDIIRISDPKSIGESVNISLYPIMQGYSTVPAMTQQFLRSAAEATV
jgi:hypothetical protein